MAIASTLLGVSATLILQPSAGQRFGTTSMWICNNDSTTRTVSIFLNSSASLASTIISQFPIGAHESKEFSLERIALEGGADAIYGSADVGSLVSVNVSYIDILP